MKTVLQSAVLCGIVSSIVTAPVMAQSGSANAGPQMAFRIGSYSPAKSYARNAGGSRMFGLELDFNIQSVPERNESNVLSLGFIEKGDLRIMPLTVTQIVHDRKRTSSYDFYYGYGVGLYSIRLRGADVDGKVKVMPGALGVFGVNLSDSTFVEARYHYSGDYDSKDVRGLLLSVGLRF